MTPISSHHCTCEVIRWERREKGVLPASEGGGKRGREREAGGRKGPNNICTFEKMNKKVKVITLSREMTTKA
jgi:hypothetical protein